MSECNFVDNNGLIELIERGLKKGYWDKALIPELKKRFKEIEKKEKLLNRIKDIVNRPDDSYIVALLEQPKRYAEIIKIIEELENE